MKNYENILLKALEEKHYFTNEDLHMNKRNTVIYQSPDQGEKIKEGDTIMLYMG